MSDLAAMTRRLDELDAAVRQLKRRRASGWALVIVGCLIGWLARWALEPAAVHAQAGGPQDLVARTLKIVNGETKTILLLDADADGGFIRLSGHDGVERSFLGVGDKKGGGLLYLRGADGKQAPAVLAIGDNGGYLRLNGFKQGKPHVYLGTGAKNWGGLLLLHDTDGNPRTEIGQGKNGGYINLLGNKNNVNFTIATSDDQRGSFLHIRDAGGRSRVELGIDDAGDGYIDDFRK